MNRHKVTTHVHCRRADKRKRNGDRYTTCSVHAHKRMEKHLASVHDTNDSKKILHIHVDLNNQHFHVLILQSPHVHGGKTKYVLKNVSF